MREILGISILLFLVGCHYKSIEPGILKKLYFAGLMLKLGAGITVGLVYTYYYQGGDTWTYFYQAKILGQVAFSSTSNFINLYFKSNYGLVEGFAYPFQPRAALMVKIVALINVLTNHNYWLTSFFFSFFSFWGLFKFASWVSTSFKFGTVAGVTLFIWPSFVFWSSGILKESLAVGLIFGLIASFMQMLTTKKYHNIITLLLGLYLLFAIKYYYAAVLLVLLLLYSISLIFNPIAIRFSRRTVLWQVFAFVILLITGFMLAGLLHPNLKPGNILGVIIGNNEAFLAKSTQASTIYFYAAKPAWIWLLINTPKALFSSLVMPLWFYSFKPMYIIVVLENWLLLGLFIRGMYLTSWAKVRANFSLLFVSVSYVSMLAVFLALSTPNFGTLARYKVAFIPVVLVLIVCMNKPINRV
ncbi:MAG: hypothetical protein L3J06_03720 [Cyclobacteriaceae bacterium]|nr:hypothetical protein [Cyclobacteriaceae bacterium]